MLLDLSLNWHSSSATEQLAARRAAELLPHSVNCMYLAYDWQSAFRQIDTGELTQQSLIQQLSNYRNRWLACERVVTVCQHERALGFAEVFAELGITDVYCAGLAVPAQNKFGVQFQPFPLYLRKAKAAHNSVQQLWQGFFSDDLTSVRPQDVTKEILPGPAGLWQLLADEKVDPKSKIQVLKQLQLLYGERVLIGDIIALFCELTFTASRRISVIRQALINYKAAPDFLKASFIATTFLSSVMLEPGNLRNLLALPNLQENLALANKHLPSDKRQYFNKVLYSNGVVPNISRRKINYILLGSHANRLPLAYPAYRPYFNQYMRSVDTIHQAEVVIMGYVSDFKEVQHQLRTALKLNPELKIIILSEEPFWDTLWGGRFYQLKDIKKLNSYSFEYYNINHCTSSVYDFEYIPYFITTEDHYFSRYCALFSRNAAFSTHVYQENWQAAKFNLAFLAQKRTSDKYSMHYEPKNIIGLCQYRSALALSFLGNRSVHISGKGWHSEARRQDLPDWHLDKLALLDRQVRFMSAIENTHDINYVTEKFFDGFALAAIPIYFAGPNHKVLSMVPGDSFINLYGLDVKQAQAKLENFAISQSRLDAYMMAQQQLNKIFSKPEHLHLERSRVAAAVIQEIEIVLNS